LEVPKFGEPQRVLRQLWPQQDAADAITTLP
jgi:hypothetical protein